MFRSERELVEKLVSDLQERYNTQYIVRELRGGNNIADVVYTTELKRDNVVFDEYFNAYYYFNGIYNKKKISLDELGISDSRVNKKFYNFLRELEELASNPEYKRKNPIVKIKEKEENKFGYVEDSMTDLIGNRVRIKNKKIIIPFNSEKDLERILDILKVEVKVD